MSTGDVKIHSNRRSSPTQPDGKLNKISGRLTENPAQGGSQAMLYAVGLDEKTITNPQVGISPVWWEGNPCNAHLLELARKVKEGCEAEGINGFMFSTIGVSDGMTMSTEGMRYSLPSRDLIADSIEAVTMAQHYDGNISIPGCDKNMPGCLMAALRHNLAYLNHNLDRFTYQCRRHSLDKFGVLTPSMRRIHEMQSFPTILLDFAGLELCFP